MVDISVSPSINRGAVTSCIELYDLSPDRGAVHLANACWIVGSPFSRYTSPGLFRVALWTRAMP